MIDLYNLGKSYSKTLQEFEDESIGKMIKNLIREVKSLRKELSTYKIDHLKRLVRGTRDLFHEFPTQSFREDSGNLSEEVKRKLHRTMCYILGLSYGHSYEWLKKQSDDDLMCGDTLANTATQMFDGPIDMKVLHNECCGDWDCSTENEDYSWSCTNKECN